MTEHVAVYARLSKLKGRDDTIETQVELSTAEAQRRWPGCAVVVYKDPDISAADPTKVRPDFVRLLGDVAAGKVTQIIASDQERITRQPAEWEMLIQALRAAGIDATYGYRDGRTGVRLGETAAGRYKVVGAAEYVEGIKIKVKEKQAVLASQGRPLGHNGLGFRPAVDERGDKIMVHDPLEAELLDWSADAVLRGWSMAEVAREWDRRGVPRLRKVRGSDPGAPPAKSTKPWVSQAGVIRRALLKPSIAGLRTHKGELGTATWEPIIDEAKWRQVTAVLTTPATVTGRDGVEHPVLRRHRPPRKYLLTGGLSICGRAVCGAPLVGQQRRFQNHPTAGLIPYYMCHPSKGGCSKIGIAGEAFEDFVSREFLAELATPAFIAALNNGDAYAERRDEITEELKGIDREEAELGELWSAKPRRISTSGWVAAQAGLDTQRAELSRELAALPVELPTVDPESIIDDWDEATVQERRHFISMFVEAVVVGPGARGKRISDEALRDRIDIRWRTRS